MKVLAEAFDLALRTVRLVWMEHLLKDVVRKRIAYEDAMERAGSTAMRWMKPSS